MLFYIIIIVSKVSVKHTVKHDCPV